MPNPFNTRNVSPSMQIKNIYKILKQSNNPTLMFEQLARTNPQMQPVLQMLKNGNNPEQIFNSLCKERGINPQEFIKSLEE